MSIYTMAAIAVVLYWLVGLWVLAIPLAKIMYRRQFEVQHFLAWWEWVNTFTILPLFWPVMAWDVWRGLKQRRGR